MLIIGYYTHKRRFYFKIEFLFTAKHKSVEKDKRDHDYLEIINFVEFSKSKTTRNKLT